jgi:hypothetical protein
MWKRMHYTAVLCLVYSLCAVVPQGLCRDFGTVLQKSGTTEERDGTGILGLQVLRELRLDVRRESECKTQGSERQSGCPGGEDDGERQWAGGSTATDRVGAEGSGESREHCQQHGETVGGQYARGAEGTRSNQEF